LFEFLKLFFIEERREAREGKREEGWREEGRGRRKERRKGRGVQEGREGRKILKEK